MAELFGLAIFVAVEASVVEDSFAFAGSSSAAINVQNVKINGLSSSFELNLMPSKVRKC